MSDFKFFSEIMPNYFVTVRVDQKREVWRCRSNTGIPDEGKWDLVVMEFKQRWPGRFLEINHTTCTNHVDFDVCLKPKLPQ
jgi:hypothetical protein